MHLQVSELLRDARNVELLRLLCADPRIGTSELDHGDDPRQILTQGPLRPDVRASAAAATRTAGVRVVC